MNSLIVLIYFTLALLCGLYFSINLSISILSIGFFHSTLMLIKQVGTTASIELSPLSFQILGLLLTFGFMVIVIHAVKKYFTGTMKGYKRMIKDLNDSLAELGKSIETIEKENETLKQELYELETIYTGITEIGTCLEYKTILVKLMDTVFKFIDFTGGAFYLIQAKKDDFDTIWDNDNFLLRMADQQDGQDSLPEHKADIDFMEARHSVTKVFSIQHNNNDIEIIEDTFESIQRDILDTYNKNFFHEIGEIPAEKGGKIIIIPILLEHELLGIILLKTPTDTQAHQSKLADLFVYFSMELKKLMLYETVKDLSIVDSLSGLYLRRYFHEKIEMEIQHALLNKTPLSLIMIDIDDFKSVNDKYGHQTGDRIIQETARILEANAREIDLIARFGGDEFYIALPKTSKKDAITIAQRIDDAFKSKDIQQYNSDKTLTISVCMGIAEIPGDGKSYPQLLDCADMALYRSKKTGKGSITAYKT